MVILYWIIQSSIDFNDPKANDIRPCSIYIDQNASFKVKLKKN